MHPWRLAGQRRKGSKKGEIKFPVKLKSQKLEDLGSPLPSKKQ